jgi:hypothetical protein
LSHGVLIPNTALVFNPYPTGETGIAAWSHGVLIPKAALLFNPYPIG